VLRQRQADVEERILRGTASAAGNTPGRRCGATNFGPLANGLLAKLNKRKAKWQIWSIERRENLLEDHSYLQKYVDGEVTNKEMFDYYLTSLIDPSISPKFAPKTTEETTFARQWGLNVAVRDIKKVVNVANRGGRKVVLGGHSLGGSITTAYATWDFNGKAGARDLDGLVFIDGAGGGRDAAERPGKESPLIPAELKPPVPSTNLAQYGYAVDSDTGPESLRLVQSHIGQLADSGEPRFWVNGELGTATRAARVFAEKDGMDGTSWYHPTRLSIDAGSIDNGNENPAQGVYGVKATRGKRVKLPMYSFDAELGNGRVAEATRGLAKQSGVPDRMIRTVNRAKTYAHIDPLSALPTKNDFIKTLVPFLRKQIR